MQNKIQLPTRGALYGGQIPEGTVTAKTFTTRDEKPLAETNRIGVIMRTYFSAGLELPPGFNPLDLTTGDRLYLMFVIRAMNYGDTYQFEWRCPRCRVEQVNDPPIVISQMPVKYLPEDAREPFFVRLPITGVEVGFRLMRGHDEERRERLDDDVQMKEQFSKRALNLGPLVASIDGAPYNGAVNTADRYKAQIFIDGLPPLDSIALEDAVQDKDAGLELDHIFRCTNPACFAPTKMIVPVAPEFFRPFRGR